MGASASATTAAQHSTKSTCFLQFVTQLAGQSVEDIGTQRAFAGQKIVQHDGGDADAGRDFGQREFTDGDRAAQLAAQRLRAMESEDLPE